METLESKCNQSVLDYSIVLIVESYCSEPVIEKISYGPKKVKK